MAIDTKRMFSFLGDLRENNERTWFDANRARYEAELVSPAMALIEALSQPLERVSSHFEAIAKKQGGSLFRIFRDTRFSVPHLRSGVRSRAETRRRSAADESGTSAER